jgi:hypothetical protein
MIKLSGVSMYFTLLRFPQIGKQLTPTQMRLYIIKENLVRVYKHED